MAVLASTTLTVSSKGQIAIPKEFRIAAGLEAGERLLIEYNQDGTLTLHPVTNSIREIFGVAKKYAKKGRCGDNDDDLISAFIAEEDTKTKRGKTS